jgi:hypothetical protein
MVRRRQVKKVITEVVALTLIGVWVAAEAARMLARRIFHGPPPPPSGVGRGWGVGRF